MAGDVDTPRSAMSAASTVARRDCWPLSGARPWWRRRRPPNGVAEAAPRQIDITAPGPLGPVTVFGDSVLLGSALWGPTLPDRLAERGWGPIKFRAGEGYNTRTGSFGARTWLSAWRSQGWDAPNVLINLGANDSGICNTNITCAAPTDPGGRRRDRPGPHDLVAADHPPLHGVRSAGQLESGAPGVRRRAQRLLHVGLARRTPAVPVARRHPPDRPTATGPARSGWPTCSPATSPGHAGPARRHPCPTATASPATFVPIPGERIVDTRNDGSGPLTPGETRAVDFDGIVPDDASAVALYVGAARTQSKGYFAAGPCGPADVRLHGQLPAVHRDRRADDRGARRPTTTCASSAPVTPISSSTSRARSSTEPTG